MDCFSCLAIFETFNRSPNYSIVISSSLTVYFLTTSLLAPRRLISQMQEGVGKNAFLITMIGNNKKTITPKLTEIASITDSFII